MTYPGRIVSLGFVFALCLLPPAAWAGDAFFAATGTWSTELPEDEGAAKEASKALDPVVAAEAATKDMMAKFEAAGKTPSAVIFLDRVKESRFHGGKDVGDKVKEIAGGAATFGHGGCGTYGVTMSDVKDKTPTFMVIGLAGEGLDVQGYLSEGKINYTYLSKDIRKKAEAGDAEAQKKVEDEKALREACFSKGKALGEAIVPPGKSGFVMLLGAMHNNWHVTFTEGFVESFGTETPLVGGVGKWDDYVYKDGESARGQMAIVIQGNLKIAAAGVNGANTWKKQILQSEMAQIHKKVDETLGETQPEALLTFCCVTRMRNPKLNPADKLKDLRTLWGQDVAIFGGFCGGEIGWDLEGKMTAGGDHLTVMAIAGNDE
jgi:hypothetical protein